MSNNYKDDMEIKIMEAFTSVKSDKEIGMPDIEEELSKLLRKKSEHCMNIWHKIAASIAVIITISCFAVAAIINRQAIVNIFTNGGNISMNEKTFTTEVKDAQRIHTDTTLTISRVIAFNNAELCEIMDSISNIYKIEVTFINEEVKHLHLHFKFCTDDKLDDVIPNLDMFDKINIKEKEGILEVE